MTAMSIRLNRLSPGNWLKRLGLFIVGFWVIVLVAAVASLIYQKFDGPTIQSVTAANLSLEDQNLSLNSQLSSSQSNVSSLQSQLSISSAKLDAVVGRIEAVEKEGERIMKVVERFVTVVPLELPPNDLKISLPDR